MTKVKIIQIALAGEDQSEYLDDKGRVWYPAGHWETLEGDADRIWITRWKLLDLPEEPGQDH